MVLHPDETIDRLTSRLNIIQTRRGHSGSGFRRHATGLGCGTEHAPMRCGSLIWAAVREQ